jgi:hypothetical protein
MDDPQTGGQTARTKSHALSVEIDTSFDESSRRSALCLPSISVSN